MTAQIQVKFLLRFTCRSLAVLFTLPLALLWLTPALAQEASGKTAPVTDSSAAQPLESGKSIERALNGRDLHVYQVTLQAGEYLHVVVEQKGIDVLTTLFGPKSLLMEVDTSNRTQGLEHIFWIAQTSGVYRIEVQSLLKTASPGKYEVKIEALRMATPQDKDRATAEQILLNAGELRALGTAQTQKAAIAQYQKAEEMLRVLGDRDRLAYTLEAIAAVYSELGDNQKALDYADRAAELRREMSDRSAVDLAIPQDDNR